MKFPSILAGIAVALCPANAAPIEERAAGVQGFDISNWQHNVDFPGAYKSGARFVIIKATEGTTFIDPLFSSHYIGATNAGFIRGGYHFARPDVGPGSAQANFFLAHGGGWTADGITLPGMIDMESTSGKPKCYSKTAAGMVAWIQDFVNTYHAKTGRFPMIYTNRDWWVTCTGNSAAFHTTCPLVFASWNSSPGPIPGGWPYQTIWQNADKFPFGGDSDIFNGDMAGLKKLATG